MSLVHLASVCSHLQNASLARLGMTSIPYTKLHLQISLLLQKQGFFSSVDLAGPTPPLSRLPLGIHPTHRKPSTKECDRESALLRLVRRKEVLSARYRSKADDEYDESIIKAELETFARNMVRAHGFSVEDVQWAQKRLHLSSKEILENGVEVDAMGLTIEGQPLDSMSRTIDTSEEGIITNRNRASRRLWLGLKYWNGEPVLRKAKMISKPTKRIWLNNQDLARVARGGEAGVVKGLAQIGEIMAVSTDRGIMDVRECVERQLGGQPLARFW